MIINYRNDGIHENRERVVRTMLGIEHDDLYLVKLQEYIFLQRSWVSTDDTLCTRGQYKYAYFRYVNERVMPMRERDQYFCTAHSLTHKSLNVWWSRG